MMPQPKDEGFVTSAREGTCTTCDAKGVLVSAPPMSRHIDALACEVQRGLNVIALRAPEALSRPTR